MLRVQASLCGTRIFWREDTQSRALDEGGGEEARPADRTIARTEELLLDCPCELINSPRRQPYIGGVRRVRHC